LDHVGGEKRSQTLHQRKGGGPTGMFPLPSAKRKKPGRKKNDKCNTGLSTKKKESFNVGLRPKDSLEQKWVGGGVRRKTTGKRFAER